MRILLISEFFPKLSNPVFSGGVEARTYFIAQNLSKKHQITVLSRKRRGEEKQARKGSLLIKRLGFPVKKEEASISSLFLRFLFVFQAIVEGLKQGADVIEASNYVVYFPAFVIGAFKRIPKIAWYPDVFKGSWKEYFGNLLGRFGEIGESIFLRLPWDQYIAISKPVAKKLERAGVDKNKVNIVPCGADVKNLKSQISNLKYNQLIVVSRLLNYKRVDWAVRLIKELGKNFPKLKLVIIGEGPEKKKLKQLACKIKVIKRVRFLSKLPLNILYEKISQSKLLLHPSVVEGFGIVLVEAAALGTPFVAVDIETSRYLAKALGSGLICDKDNWRDFAKKTKSILNDTNQYNALKESGLVNCSKFNWERIAEKTENIYKKSI